MSTLKVDTILKRTGTGTITVGQSGDTISIPSGATLNSAGTNTLSGIANTPSFIATKTSSQTGVSDNSFTKVTWDNVVHDSNSGFSTSDNRYTIPSGEGGVYQISFSNLMYGASANFNYAQTRLYKNGSYLSPYVMELNYDNSNANGETYHPFMSICVSLAAGDYIEVYGRLDVSSGNVTFGGEDLFSGFKLLGA